MKCPLCGSKMQSEMCTFCGYHPPQESPKNSDSSADPTHSFLHNFHTKLNRFISRIMDKRRLRTLKTPPGALGNSKDFQDSPAYQLLGFLGIFGVVQIF